MLTSEALEERVVQDLAKPRMTYDLISQKYDISRGKIWNIAVRNKARKNELRIRERLEDRKRRQREFLNEVLDATETCDVLDFLDGLPDESVRLHLTSPPYNTGKKYGDSPEIDRRRFTYYLGWMLQVLSEMERTLAPGGVIALQLGNTVDDDGERYPLDILLFQYLRTMPGLKWQDRPIWTFPHGLTPEGRLSNRYETVLVFSKGATATFNTNSARVPQKEPGKRAFKGPNRGRLSGHPLGAHPSDVWPVLHMGSNNPERTGHPAQFPEELVERAVNLYTLPGDLVCDVFSGSGTSMVVAKRTGRAFVGCDLFYEDLRRERLRQVAPDLASRLPGVTPDSVAVWQAEARAVKIDAEQQRFE